jgi:hypothetical protein
MVEIVTIAPLVREPGLIAYECAACGYVTSVLISAYRYVLTAFRAANDETPRAHHAAI